MYELIEIEECTATRFVKLKNLATGMIEDCFDDSSLISDDNFEFMKIGQQYECKIELFGKPVAEKVHNSIICKVIDKEIVLGHTIMVEVEVNTNKYYIPKREVIEYLDCENFNFCFTRKDLVQVNDVIHADLL